MDPILAPRANLNPLGHPIDKKGSGDWSDSGGSPRCREVDQRLTSGVRSLGRLRTKATIPVSTTISGDDTGDGCGVVGLHGDQARPIGERMPWLVSRSVARPITKPSMARRPFHVSAKETNPKRDEESVMGVAESALFRLTVEHAGVAPEALRIARRRCHWAAGGAMVEIRPPPAGSMHPPSPEQALVLAAIERFMADPDLALADLAGEGASGVQAAAAEAGDVLAAILRALSLVLPLEEIELAVTGLLTTHCDSLDEDTQLVLEALLSAIEPDDDGMDLDSLLVSEASLLEANALEGNLLLVWDPAEDASLQELEILELLERYPCRGAAARWTCDDFVALLEGKILQWHRTMTALEILQEHPGSRPSASTMVLMVPEDPKAPLEQLEVGVALTRAGSNGAASAHCPQG